MTHTPALVAAETFLWLNARPIDRLRYAALFKGDDPTRVLAALRPYQNADGGFGNGLEPDLRGPASQPQPVEVALRVLDEVDGFGDPMVPRACDYLMTITTGEGGVPFVLPSVSEYPHAPWWQTGDDPPASLNPTAAIAGLLHKHAVEHPWLDRATDYCWEQISALEQTSPYEARAILTFLDHVPDRDRAEAAFQRIGAMILDQGLVALDPAASGDVHSPLDYAPTPESMARRLFSDSVIEAHLDALVAAQQDDGGWRVPWPSWTPAAGIEWRGWMTVHALKVLRAYGRLPGASITAED